MTKPERTSPSDLRSAGSDPPIPAEQGKASEEAPKPPARPDSAFHLSAIGVVWLGG